jgi:hypothetical protein
VHRQSRSTQPLEIVVLDEAAPAFQEHAEPARVGKPVAAQNETAAKRIEAARQARLLAAETLAAGETRLRIAEELARLLVQEDGVFRDAVFFEHLLQLGPDRAVAVFVFLFGAGMDRKLRNCPASTA